jgi:hypothetical protein
MIRPENVGVLPFGVHEHPHVRRGESKPQTRDFDGLEWINKKAVTPREQTKLAGVSPGKSDSSWRKTQDFPVHGLLDENEASKPREPVSPQKKSFAEFKGYDRSAFSGAGKGGYGAEGLFGVKTADRKPDLDLQIAQWRLGPTYDANPFTLDGSVPPASARKDTHRRKQPDLMATLAEDDSLGREGLRQERMRLPADNAPWSSRVELSPGISLPRQPLVDPSAACGTKGSWRLGDDHPVSFDGSILPRRVMTGDGVDSAWRIGDAHPLTLDGRILQRPKPNPVVDTSWRMGTGIVPYEERS